LLHHVIITPCYYTPDNSEIKQFSWAADQPLNPTKNTDHIQLRKADGYKWRTSSGSNVYEDPDGWSVNKYICQCE